MDYERRILIVDGPEGELQETAMKLIEGEYDVHYANDLAEAQLLAGEHRGTVGGVLVSSALDIGPVSEFARRLGVEPASLVPMGQEPCEREVAALRHHGVRWHLWGEPDDQAIRFVLASVLSEQDELELRLYLRIPSRIPAALEIGDRKNSVTLCDLSLGGACIMGNSVGAEGDLGELKFYVGELELDLPVRVVWRVGGSGDDVEVGGLSFTEVDPAAGRIIDKLVDAVVGRQRIPDQKED